MVHFRVLIMATSSGIGLTYHLTRLSIGLKKTGHDVCVLSQPKEQIIGLSTELTSAGIMHFISNHVDKRTIRDICLTAREIREIVELENIDVIHAQGTTHAVVAHLARRTLPTIRKPSIVTTVHNIPSENLLDNPKWATMITILDKCSDLIIPVSNNTKLRLAMHGLNPEKMKTIHNAIDLKVFDADLKKFKIDHGTKKNSIPNVVCGGDLIPRKGHNYYLMAASEVLKNFSSKFYIVGGGPRRQYLEDLARRLKIDKDVVFTGRISWPEMYHLFSSVADICVSASLRELFPYYVLECMAAGKPIVATNVGGVAEAVIDGVNGYVVPPKDPGSLTNAMLKLMTDSVKAKEMGNNSRAIAEKQFDLPKMVSDLTRCYHMSVIKRV